MKRDYDEEEKGYSSGIEGKKTEMTEYLAPAISHSASYTDNSLTEDGSNLQQLDMDMSD